MRAVLPQRRNTPGPVRLLPVLLAPWLLSGCLAPSIPDPPAPAATVETARPVPVTLPAGGAVVVPLSAGHPPKLAVVRADGTWLYLVDDGLVREPLMSEAAFAAVTLLRVDANAWQGLRFVGGKATREPVFTTPGRYQLYLADNLETEPDNAFVLYVDIDYRPR